MPLFYVYSPTDFVEGLPNEAGSAAAGRPDFTLTLKPGASPTAVNINDDDPAFDEIDSSQVLASAVTIDGQTYAAGTTVHAAYDLIDSTSGHMVTSLHFGGNGYQQGAVDGLISTIPLVPNQTYVFDTERTSHRQNNPFSGYVACFMSGVRIETEFGEQNVEDLVPAVRLRTYDAGLQPLRLRPRRYVSAAELASNPNLRPIKIAAGALGNGLPRRDIFVSPQHRFLFKSPVAKRMFDTEEVLVAAKKMVTLPGIDVHGPVGGIEYHHLLLNRHEIIFAAGAPTESFYFGHVALASLSPEQLEEVHILYPKLRTVPAPDAQSIRYIPRSKQQKRIVERHARNRKPVLAE